MWTRAVAVAAAVLAGAAATVPGPADALPLRPDERAIADPATTCADPVFTEEVASGIERIAAGRGVTAAVYDTRRRCWHHLAPGLRITTASVIKAEILAGVVLAARREGRHLTPWERARARRMIRYSHNSPPTGELLAHIGGVAGMQRLDSMFGATSTDQSPVYGAVRSTATDRTLVTAGLLWGGGPIDETGRALAVSFMDDVHPTQTWGVTAGVPAGHRVALKNGFYPMSGQGWRVGSTGLVRAADGDGYAITVMTDANADQVSGMALVEAVSSVVAGALLPGPPVARAVDEARCVTAGAGQSWTGIAAALGLPAARGSEVRDVSGGNAAPLGGQRACSPDLAPRPIESCVVARVHAAPPPATDGYVLVGSTGALDSWGVPLDGAKGCRPGTAIDVAVGGAGRWWVLTTAGAVVAGGGAPHHGDALHHEVGAPHGGGALNGDPPGTGWVAVAAGDDGSGYLLAAGGGEVRAFGTSSHHGDASNLVLTAPVVDMVATPTGDGYWLAAADGGIFAFGAADFHGSTGAIALDEPVTAIVGSGSGGSGSGYLLVGADGGVFAFGAAEYLGGLGATTTPWPITGAARR